MKSDFNPAESSCTGLNAAISLAVTEVRDRGPQVSRAATSEVTKMVANGQSRRGRAFIREKKPKL